MKQSDVDGGANRGVGNVVGGGRQWGGSAWRGGVSFLVGY